MLPGPDLIYKCPACGNLLKNKSLSSGNTFGATRYSDGKRIAPMLPRYPDLTKCNKCDSIFLLSDLKEIEKHDTDKEWKNAPYAEFLSIKDLFRALDKYKDKEIDIRVDIWWTFNDRLRWRGDRTLFIEEEDTKLWKENCESLIKLLDTNDTNQKIMIAELYRNLGQFEKCEEIISNLSSDLDWLKEQFIEECKKENSFVFQLN